MSIYPNIPFHKPTVTGEELNSIQTAVSTGSWITICEESKLFFKDYYNGSACFFTNSCSSALEMAIMALDIKNGDEIIIPGFCYVALANAVVNCGAKPVFADVTFPGGGLDVESAARCVSPRTRAIIALHYAGNPCNITGVSKLCKKHNILLIEDAAQCIGSNYNNQPLGSFGQIGCLSFDYMKNISCGQGGLLIVNDNTLVNKVQTIYDNGTNRYALLSGSQKFFEWVGKGVNCQMNPVASYFLAAQLKAIQTVTENRLNKWNLYYQLLLPLAEKGKVILNSPEPTHNGHIFYIITGSEQEKYSLRSFLAGHRIYCEHHYSSIAKSPYGRQFVGEEVSLHNAEKLCGNLLRLPLWHNIGPEDIKAVVSKIEAFYSDTNKSL